VNKDRKPSKATLYFSLGDSTISKLAISRKNTRKNPDDKQTSPVSDPEKILKSRRSLRQVISPIHTICQPDFTQLNVQETLERSVSLPLSYDTFSFPEVFSPDFREPSPHTFRASASNLSMAAHGGAGAGGGAPGGPAGGQAPLPGIFAKVAARYAPLVLPVPLHDLPENYMKSLPKFTGEGDLTAQEHINFFDQFADILGIEHEDVYSRLLVQTFEGQVRTWFRSLAAGSLRSYEELESAFIRQWGERRDHLYYLTEFRALRKKNSESVLEFTQRFNKLYNKILVEVKPSQPAAKVTFVGAFDPDFALLLRERRSTDLTKMQDDALEIESNMMASGKLKAKIETGNKENRKFKEQGGSSGSGKSSGDKIDEMARVIRELSNKISKMELDKSKRDNFPRKDFRRNPDPQAPQKIIKNEDQKIPTPFKSENFIGEEDLENFEEFDEDINNLGDDNKSPYLSRQDYEKSLNNEIRSEDDVSNDTSEDWLIRVSQMILLPNFTRNII
jgi:hypothetical protein